MTKRWLPAALQGFALVLAMGLALCAPSAARAASDGTGTMGVSTTGPVVASSTGNTLTFTYTADSSGVTLGTVEIAVPDGWSAPQTDNSSAPGYVSADALGLTTSAGGDGTGGTITLSGLTLLGGAQVQITYSNATPPATGGLDTFTSSEGDGTDTPVALAASPTVQVLAPDGSGTMVADPGSVPAGSSQSFLFTYIADPGGVQSGTVDLTVPSGWTTPQTVDSTSAGYVTTSLGASDSSFDQVGTVSIQPSGTIHMTGVTLAAGDTLVISYGNVTAPSAASYTFTTDESSAGGTAVDLATQPQVTVTPVTVPGAPSLASAVPGDGTVDLSWSAPTDDGGAPVTDYLINEYTGSDTSSTPTVIDTGSSATTTPVSGLTNGQEYTFTVQAVNSAGSGSASGPLSATPVTVPGSPSLTSATPGDGQLTLSWSAPSDDGGSPVTDYVIEEYQGGNTSGTATSIDTHSIGTSATVSGLTNGSTYTFTVEAVNAVGPSLESGSLSAIPAATVPGVPNLQSATGGNGNVTLSWSAPSDDGGSPVTGYVVEEYVGGDTSGTPTPIDTDSTSLSYTVSGLTNGQQYTFTVEAVNSVGAGMASSSLSATPATVPGAPTLTSAVPGDGTVDLSWSAPTDDGGAPVSDYKIYEYQGGDTSATPTVIDAGSSTTASLSGLTNRREYTFTVVAVNSAGDGGPSNQLSATPVTFPGSPSLTSATGGNGTVDLSWSAPSDDGGSLVTDYVIEEYLGGNTSGTPTLVDTNSTGTSYTVPGLTNGQQYTFTVEAVNAVGMGPASGSLSATPGATAPSPPALQSATGGNGAVDLSWSAPSDDGGSPITDYVIEEYVGAGTSGTPVSFDTQSTGTSYRVSGLTNGQQYTFTVEAVNAVGTGPASGSLSATPAPVVPGAPALQSATGGNGQVQLSWSAPSDDGGSPVTDYVVEEYLGGGTSGTPAPVNTGSTSTSYTVSGLTNGQQYTFTVEAVNSVGAGSASSSLSATPATIPGAPSLTSASPQNGTVDLSWSAPSDDGGSLVTDYVIEEYLGGNTSGTPTLVDTNSTGTSYTVPGLTNGQQYTFTVEAVNLKGNSAASAPLSTTPRTVPDAPTLTATPGAGKVTLSWTRPADGGAAIDHYVIAKYLGASATGTPTTTSTSTTSQTVTGLANGTAYTFEIQAVNAAGPSAPSNAETATPATVPTAPKLLATVAGPGVVEVVWGPPVDDGGATIGSYDIFRSTTPGSKGIQVASQAPTASTNSYIDQSVANGTTYYYQVVAVNRAGESPASAQFSAEPQSSLLPPLLLKTLTLDGHKVTFSSPNKCVRPGRIPGKLTISTLKPHSPRVVISKALFKVGTLARKTITRRRPSAAPLHVTLRAKHMLSKHSYEFLAEPSIEVGKSAPHRHALRLRITAC